MRSVVARHRHAGRSVAHGAGSVRQEDVQHLRRADAVEDLDAVVRSPALADVLRQRFAGRHADAQPDVGLRGKVRRRKHRGVERRHAVEDRRAIRSETFRDGRWRWALGHQHGGCADRQRKRERVAEAIGEEQLRRREHDIVLPDAEDAAAVQLRGLDEAGVDMHRALRHAGRARRVEPEANVVRTGRRGVECIGPAREQRVEREMATGIAAGHDDVREMRQLR